MTEQAGQLDTARGAIVRELAQRLANTLDGDPCDEFDDQDWHRLADTAFDHLAEDHRMVSRFLNAECPVTVTIHHDNDSTITATGPITGHTIGVHAAIVNALEITGATLDEQPRITIDEDCPNCRWGQRWYAPAQQIFGCRKCAYRSTQRDA